VLPGESSCGSLDLDLRTEATDPRSWRSGICTDVADRGVIVLFRSRLAGGGGGVDGAWRPARSLPMLHRAGSLCADNYWMDFDNY
jgi:hypothetical protein